MTTKHITVDWLGLAVWWMVAIMAGALGLILWLGERAWQKVRG